MKRKLEDLAPQDFSHYAEQARQRMEMFTYYAPVNNAADKLTALHNLQQCAAAVNLTLVAYTKHAAEHQKSVKR